MEEEKTPIIDLQHVLESFNIDLIRDDHGKVIAHQNPGANILLFPDPSIKVIYRFKYGGSVKPEYAEIPGYFIPLMYNYEIYIPEIIDHYNGCSNLDYDTHPENVEKYVERLLKFLNNENPVKKLFLDPGLNFDIPKKYYPNIYEGITPVLVWGKSVTGIQIPEDQKKMAYLITGNCV